MATITIHVSPEKSKSLFKQLEANTPEWHVHSTHPFFYIMNGIFKGDHYRDSVPSERYHAAPVSSLYKKFKEEWEKYSMPTPIISESVFTTLTIFYYKPHLLDESFFNLRGKRFSFITDLKEIDN